MAGQAAAGRRDKHDVVGITTGCVAGRQLAAWGGSEERRCSPDSTPHVQALRLRGMTRSIARLGHLLRPRRPVFGPPTPLHDQAGAGGVKPGWTVQGLSADVGRALGGELCLPPPGTSSSHAYPPGTSSSHLLPSLTAC